MLMVGALYDVNSVTKFLDESRKILMISPIETEIEVDVDMIFSAYPLLSNKEDIFLTSDRTR